MYQMLNVLKPVTVGLNNRLGRPVDLEVQCLEHRNSYYLFLIPGQDIHPKQLTKSAEHFAFQLVQRLAVKPEEVRFFYLDRLGKLDSDGSPLPQWRQLLFKWVEGNPVYTGDRVLTATAIEAYLAPVLTQGVDCSNRLHGHLKSA